MQTIRVNKSVRKTLRHNRLPSGSKLRSERGVQAFELGFGALAIILMTMLSLDLIMPMIGDNILDRAARDATRAAAAQADSTHALAAANAALISHKTDGFWITQPALTSTSSPDFVYQDFKGDPTAGNPFVNVTCACKVRLPVNIAMFGQSFSGPTGDGTFTFKRSYQFPIIKFQLGQSFH
jgi:Flp pilus assembly protein TadG